MIQVQLAVQLILINLTKSHNSLGTDGADAEQVHNMVVSLVAVTTLTAPTFGVYVGAMRLGRVVHVAGTFFDVFGCSNFFQGLVNSGMWSFKSEM